MSQLKTNSIVDASGGNTTTINGYTPTLSNMAGRNRIINGAMDVAQRGTSFSGIVSTNPDAYPADRFHGRNVDTTGVYTMSQVADAPSEFVYSIKAQTTTINSTVNGESFIEQIIEGYNTLGFAYGTSGAKSITLSFWVKASIAGTYNIWMYASPGAKAIGSSYTVSSANTWEYVSLTFVGDTASALQATNGASMYVRWYLSIGSGGIGPLNSTWSSGVTNRMVSGSVQLLNTLNATFQITGCQLEAGSVATPFERRPYGTELALCQRYYQEVIGANGGVNANFEAGVTQINFNTQMRSAPTMAEKTVLSQSNTSGVSFDATQTFGTGFYVGMTAAYWYRRSISTASAEL